MYTQSITNCTLRHNLSRRMFNAFGPSKPVRERENKGGRTRKWEATTDMNYVQLFQKKQ